MRRLLAAAAALLVLPGCARRGPDYFPLVPGLRRVMHVRQASVAGAETTLTAGDRVETVRGERDIAGAGRFWAVETRLGRDTSMFDYYRVKGESVFELVPGRGGRREQTLFLLRPPAVGRSWYDSPEERELTQVVAEESVAVPAGTFANARRLVVTSSRTDLRLERWLVPGIGVVRRVKSLSWEQDGVPRRLIQVDELTEVKVPGAGKESRPGR